MQKVPKSNKSLLIFAIIVLVLLGLYFGGKYLTRNVKVEKNVENTSIKSEDEEISVSQAGTLPEGFPQNFPLYPEAKIISSFTAQGKETNGISVVLGSQDSTEKVIEFYKSELPNKGWKIVSNFDQQGSSTISFEEDKVSGFLGITKANMGVTTISVTIGVKEK